MGGGGRVGGGRLGHLPGDGEKGFAAHGLAPALGELVDALFALFVCVVFYVTNFLPHLPCGC